MRAPFLITNLTSSSCPVKASIWSTAHLESSNNLSAWMEYFRGSVGSSLVWNTFNLRLLMRYCTRPTWPYKHAICNGGHPSCNRVPEVKGKQWRYVKSLTNLSEFKSILGFLANNASNFSTLPVCWRSLRSFEFVSLNLWDHFFALNNAFITSESPNLSLWAKWSVKTLRFVDR